MKLTRETHDNIVGAVEDAIAFAIDEARKEGELISGECAWNIVMCRAIAKVSEFEGLVGPSIQRAPFTYEDELPLADEEHY